jgi:glutaredoxin
MKKNPQGVFIIYGITDCPACLRACAAAMELYPECEYVFVETDFSKSYREKLKARYDMSTFPIIIYEKNSCKTVIGGYDELTSFIANREEYSDNSTPIENKKKEPT